MSGTATLPAGDRYVLVSADCHAGGSMEQYREYLAPEYHDEFDGWELFRTGTGKRIAASQPFSSGDAPAWEVENGAIFTDVPH